jgi:general stress protein 26
MTNSQMNSDSIWDHLEQEHVCMLASNGNEGIDARPMTPYCRKSEGVIWFVTDRSSRLADGELGDDSVSLIFQNSASNFYTTLKGSASIVDSREKIADLWTPLMREFFESPDDPRIICMAFEPHEAVYWAGPERVASAIKLALGAATGIKSKMGGHGRIAF